MRKVHLVAGAVLLLIVALAVGWYALSPGWTVKAMVDAARAGDEARFSSYVDYPALRADMKAELTNTLQSEAKRDSSVQSKLGLAVGMALMGPMIDRMVSPAAMKSTFVKLAEAQSSGAARVEGRAAGEARELPEIRRDGLNRFLVSGRDTPDSGLVFERDGLGWKLTGIELARGLGSAADRK